MSSSVYSAAVARAPFVAALCAGLGAATPALTSCGASFCVVHTDWAVQGAWNDPGWRADLRYENVLQNQPMSGRRRVSVGEIRGHHDEVESRSQRLLATLDYGFNANWGVSLSLPLVERSHHHIHNHHGAQLDERWHFRELGDARVIGRYQTALFGDGDRYGAAGLLFGAKLPSGRFTAANGDGDRAERSLQAGTGTTDAIVGAYYRGVLPQFDGSGFVQTQYQAALNNRDGYRPGPVWNVDAGYRWQAGARWAPMLQLNWQARGRDRGDLAEPDDSGGRALSLSPGFDVTLGHGMQAYAFVQLPLWQHVNGVQLTPRYALTLGVQSRF